MCGQRPDHRLPDVTRRTGTDGAVRMTRRGPWLSGVVAALLGAGWMAGQVLGGVIAMARDVVHTGDPLPAAEVWELPGGESR